MSLLKQSNLTEMLSPFLKDFIHQTPFLFDEMLDEMKHYLAKDSFIHSTIITNISKTLEIDKDIKKKLCNIIELINTTIHIHNDIKEIDEKNISKQDATLLKHNKKLILAGDLLFCQALSIIPQLHNTKAEIFLYRQTQKACLKKIDIRSKKDNPKKTRFSGSLPLLSVCFIITLFFTNSSVLTKHWYQLKKIGYFFSWAYWLRQQIVQSTTHSSNKSTAFKKVTTIQQINKLKKKILSEKNTIIDMKHLVNYLEAI